MALATLSIDLIAKLASFEADMGKAARIAERRAAEIQKSLDDLKSFAANFVGGMAVGMASAFTVGAVEAFISKTVDAGDELNRLSQITGISVDQLSAWGNVARRNGVDVDDLAEQINELQVRLAETKDSTSGAGAALKALGLDYRELQRMASDDAFRAVAAALSEVEDSGKKTALAMQIGGDEYQKLIPILNDLSSVGVDQASITAEQAAAASHYKDTIAELQDAGETWSQVIVSGMIPALDETARALVDVIAGTGGLTEEAKLLSKEGSISGWARSTVTGLSYVLDAGGVVARAFGVIGKTAAAMVAETIIAVKGVGSAVVSAASGNFGQALSDLRSAYTSTSAAGQAWVDDMGHIFSDQLLGSRLRDRIGEIQDAGSSAAAAGEKAKRTITNLGAAADAAKSAAGKASKSADGRAAEKALAEYEKLITSIRTKTAAQAQELETGEKVSEAQKMALTIMSQLRDGRLKLNDAQKTSVTGYLEELLNTEKLVDVQKSAAAWQQEAATANADAVEQRRSDIDAIAEQIQAQQNANAQIGMSSDQLAEFTRLQREDQAAALDRRAAILGDGDMAGTLRDQAQAMRDLNAQERRGIALMDDYKANASGGVSDGLRDYLDQISDVRSAASQAAGNALQQTEDAMTQFFTTGKLGVRSLIDTMLAEFMRLQVVRPMMASLTSGNGLAGLMSLFGGGSGGYTGAGSTGSGIGNAGAGDYSAWMKNALGGVYGAQAFALGGAFTNSVVSQPTLFKFAQGGAMRNGLMGEAGPEAIMPLIRMGSGHLGVRAVGGGGSVQPIIQQSFTVGEVVTRGQVLEIAQQAAVGAVRGNAAARAAVGRGD